MNVIPTFDNIASADTLSGKVLALQNGTVYFEAAIASVEALLPLGAKDLPGAIGWAYSALALAMDSKGLDWGTVHWANTSGQGFNHKLAKQLPGQTTLPTIELPGIDGAAPMMRVARSAELLANLQIVQAAFQTGDLAPLLTDAGKELMVKEADKQAKKMAKDALFTNAHWPTRAMGVTVQVVEGGFLLSGPKDGQLIKAFKASGGTWNDRAKTWHVPAKNEVALGKRLAKVQSERAELAQAPKETGALLLKQETESPLQGSSCLEVCFQAGLQRFDVKFGYNTKAINIIRGVPGVVFVQENQAWSVPLLSRSQLEKVLPRLIEQTTGVPLPVPVQTPVQAPRPAPSATSVARVPAPKAPVAPSAADKTQPPTRQLFYWSDRAGSTLPKVGVLVEVKGVGWQVPIALSKGRFDEDSSSLGGDMFRQYQFRVSARPATLLEVIDETERLHHEKARLTALTADKTALSDIVSKVKAQGTRHRWYEASDSYQVDYVAAQKLVAKGVQLFRSFGNGDERFLHLADDGKTATLYNENTHDTVLGESYTLALSQAEVAKLVEIATARPTAHIGLITGPLTGPGTNQEKLKAYLAALDATRSPPPELRVSPAEPIPGGGYSSKATLALVGTDSQHLALTADSADGAILLAREVLARAVDKGVSLPVAKEQVLAEKHTKEKAPEPDKGRA